MKLYESINNNLKESNSKEYKLVNADSNKISELENGSAFTWEGMAIDDKNLEAIKEALKENTKIKLPVIFYTWKGKEFNEKYGLTGSNAYPDDLNFLSIDLDNWSEMGSLPMWKFQVGARWLDDIVDNNARRQGFDECDKTLKESIEDVNDFRRNFSNNLTNYINKSLSFNTNDKQEDLKKLDDIIKSFKEEIDMINNDFVEYINSAYINPSDLNESEDKDNSDSFEEKVLDAYDNCHYSVRADMPTIKDILEYLDMPDNGDNRNLVCNILYKAGKDWQIES